MARTRRRSKASSSPLPRIAIAITLALAAAGARLALSEQQQPPPRLVFEGQANRFAVPDCIPRKGDEASREACRTIGEVLRNDLKFEGLFQFIPDSLIKAIPAYNPEALNFDDWKGIGAQYVVVTRAEVTSGELTLELRVHFVDGAQQILAKRYSGRADNPRVFAHQASDEIMTLTSYKGVARTKIAFTSDRDSEGGRVVKELYIMDYDGFNPRRVTVNKSINILPSWSPDGKSLAYVSYRSGAPLLFLASIYEGKSTPNLSGEKGNHSQAMAPTFSPDGSKIAYASNRSGNMDIWVADANGRNARKITTSSAADTAPCWSPTGQEIAFTSARGGTPQIYVMDSEGLNVRRLTNVGNWNDACAWNPSRQFSEIAYTSRLEPGEFEIAVIDLASRQVRQLTTGKGSCEYPSWAPSGRHLVFACNRGGTWQITLSDRVGASLLTHTQKGNNAQPDWGS
jgi:TolB protein